jgi:hypothetical protein
MAIDSGAIVATGDGSTAPSAALDGTPRRQVGEFSYVSRRPGALLRVISTPGRAPEALGDGYGLERMGGAQP